MCVCVRACARRRVCVCACVRACVCVCVYACVCVLSSRIVCSTKCRAADEEQVERRAERKLKAGQAKPHSKLGR